MLYWQLQNFIIAQIMIVTKAQICMQLYITWIGNEVTLIIVLYLNQNSVAWLQTYEILIGRARRAIGP